MQCSSEDQSSQITRTCAGLRLAIAQHDGQTTVCTVTDTRASSFRVVIAFLLLGGCLVGCKFKWTK